MTPDLKALALAAVEARKALDAGAYSSSGRELAHAKIKAFHDAATPESILQYRNEVLEEAAKVARNQAGVYRANLKYYMSLELANEYRFGIAACERVESAIRSLKAPEPKT